MSPCRARLTRTISSTGAGSAPGAGWAGCLDALDPVGSVIIIGSFSRAVSERLGLPGQKLAQTQQARPTIRAGQSLQKNVAGLGKVLVDDLQGSGQRVVFGQQRR